MWLSVACSEPKNDARGFMYSASGRPAQAP
jgi:hypothetical protein